MEHFRCFGLTFFLSILSAIAIASEETPDLQTESTSELVATNSTNSLKDGLESFAHTLTYPRGQATTEWDRDDALKRRIGRQVNGASTHRFLWGGGPGPVAEVDANGNTITTYVYGTGINAPDYMVRGAQTFALIRDHLGSVRFVLNTATNAIAQELRYDPFGKVILDTNPGFQPFGYAGGLYDPDTELTRFGARDFHHYRHGIDVFPPGVFGWRPSGELALNF